MDGRTCQVSNDRLLPSGPRSASKRSLRARRHCPRAFAACAEEQHDQLAPEAVSKLLASGGCRREIHSDLQNPPRGWETAVARFLKCRGKVTFLDAGAPEFWSRGFLSLSDPPLGVTLGICSLIVLLPLEAKRKSPVVLETKTRGVSLSPCGVDEVRKRGWLDSTGNFRINRSDAVFHHSGEYCFLSRGANADPDNLLAWLTRSSPRANHDRGRP